MNLKKLLGEGFLFFPLGKNSKIPVVKAFTDIATSNETLINQWISNGHNVAIATDHTANGEHLVVVDIDTKDGKKGQETILALEMEGKEFPKTLTQKTASGGVHLIYKTKEKVYGGVNKLGLNVDVKAHGGYIVSWPSKIGDIPYLFSDQSKVAECPPWLVELCKNTAREKDQELNSEIDFVLDVNAAKERAEFYLSHANPAIEGQGGNAQTYFVACKLKDEGVDAKTCFELMNGEWNERCDPPWEENQLKKIIANAYKYGEKKVGAASPEAVFSEVEIDDEVSGTELDQILNEFNRRFSIINTSDEILFDAPDNLGANKIYRVKRKQFENMHAHLWVDHGDKRVNAARHWLSWGNRRRYTGVCFDPRDGANTHKHYNLWRGLAYTPRPSMDDLTEAQKDVLKLVIEHIYENITCGDEASAEWFITYFADMIQRPWEKPMVAVSLFGGKGTGKSAIFNWIGALLGNHYLSSSQRRSLLGNFNGHLENLIMFNLEEAFWSGDKQAEGALKDIITGKEIVIERKGQEVFAARNFIRVTMCSNEQWSFPASEDERRLASFEVGAGKKQNVEWFQKITDGLKFNGGYVALATFLKHYDISKVDIKVAPKNASLLNQKEETLDAFGKFWLGCLIEGRILGSLEETWPTEMICSEFAKSFEDNFSSSKIFYTANPATLSKRLKKYAPIRAVQKTSGERKRMFLFPDLDNCRKAWDEFMGQPRIWD